MSAGSQALISALNNITKFCHFIVSTGLLAYEIGYFAMRHTLLFTSSIDWRFYVIMIPNFYEYSLFKLNWSHLHKFLSKIQFDEKIAEWALLEINKLNKLPTQAIAHQGFFWKW